jgi:hypothetical protein
MDHAHFLSPSKNYQMEIKIFFGCKMMTNFDAPPSSLMDSTTSLKVKTTKGEGVGAHSLARSTLGVEGRVGVLGWGLRRLTSNQLFTWTCMNQTTSWLVHSWSILVHKQAAGKHRLTRLTTAWTWGKPPPSSL